MTSPKVATEQRRDARFYVDPSGVSDSLPGVTTVLNSLPKPFLVPWATKIVAETAVECLPEVTGLVLKDRQGAIDFLKTAHRRTTDAAAGLGTEVHDTFEKMATDYRPGGPIVIPNTVSDEVLPFAEHFAAFLDLVRPEFLELEATVWSDAGGFAGSFDACFKATAGELAGRTLLADWKTTKSVHSEVAIQLAAYRSAPEIIDPDGTRRPMIETDGAVVLQVRSEGWQLIEVEQVIDDTPLTEIFAALRTVMRWEKELSKFALNQPLAEGGIVTSRIPKPRLNKPKAVPAPKPEPEAEAAPVVVEIKPAPKPRAPRKTAASKTPAKPRTPRTRKAA